MSYRHQQHWHFQRWKPDGWTTARPDHRERQYPFDPDEFRYRDVIAPDQFPVLGGERFGGIGGSLKEYKRIQRRKQRCWNKRLISRELDEMERDPPWPKLRLHPGSHRYRLRRRHSHV